MAIFDVTDALADLLEPVTVSSSLPGAYVKGHWVTGGVTTSTIFASVQPASNEDVNELRPEGDTLSSYKKFYSAYSFKPADKNTGTEADLLTFEGSDYKVLTVADWHGVGGYNKALAVKI